MKILLHACCGPCASACVPRLAGSGADVAMFYCNSNIDTLEEFEKRRDSAQKVAEAEGVEMVVAEYDHADWLEKVARGRENDPEKGERCRRCYAYNIAKAAEYAAAHGYDACTTTLTVSPHKPSPAVFAAGEAVAGEKFLKEDFKKRGGFLESVKRAKELGLYRQEYCGCEFSKRGRENLI